jgi:LacI family transcriptional regulator
MVEAIASLTRQSGFMLLLCNTGRDPVEEEHYLNLLIEQQADGVIISSSRADSRAAELLTRHGIEVVLFNRHPDRFDVNYVGVDNEGGAYTATRHLLNLGHRRIAFLRGEPGSSTSEERETGFRRALADHGLAVTEDLFYHGDFRVGASREAAARMLSGPERPSAVVAANDVMAIAVMDVALRLGLRVPQEVAVVGFDDIPIASSGPIALTTVRTDLRTLAEEATRLLLDLIRDPDHPGHQNPVRRILPVTLQIRRTCGARELAASADR